MVACLLTGSYGLPDFIQSESTLSDEELMSELFKAKLDFEAGNQFRYNQTNYWLLAQIIEKVTGLTFEGYVLKNQLTTGLSI